MSPRRSGSGPDMSGLDDIQRAMAARRNAEREHPEHGRDLNDDATASRDHDAIQDDGQDAPAAPRRRSRRTERPPKPQVHRARAMTVRMEPGEADEVDRFVLDLRDETGQRLDKADVVRELIRLAQSDDAVRRKLARRLQ